MALSWSSASAVSVSATLAPAGPTIVAPGSDEFLSLTITTDTPFTLDNLTVDWSPLALASEGTAPGYSGLLPGYKDTFVSDLIAGINLTAGSTVFTGFFDLHITDGIPAGWTITVDVKLQPNIPGFTGTVVSNPAVFRTAAATVPEPATITMIVLLGGSVVLYERIRRRRDDQ
jgi:hypothetical protein